MHKFDDIRYPETLIQNGASIRIDPFDMEKPELAFENADPDNSYALVLPQIDRLMGALFNALHVNPEFFLREVESANERVRLYYPKLIATFLGRTPAPESTGTDN